MSARAALDEAIGRCMDDLEVAMDRYLRLVILEEVREKVRRMPSHLLDVWFENEIKRLQEPADFLQP